MHIDVGTAVAESIREPRRWGGLTTATTLVALSVLTLSIPRLESLDWGAIGIMGSLALGTGLFAFRTRGRMDVSFGIAVYMASIALFGTPVALWVVATTGILLEAVVYRRPFHEAVRLLSVRLIAVGAAGIAYGLVGGRIPPTAMSVVDVISFSASFAVYGVTSSLVAAAAGLKRSWSLQDYGRWLLGQGIVVELAMLPLAMLMVACYTPGEPATFPLLAIVLIVSGAAARSLSDTRGQLVQEVARLELLTAVGALAARSILLRPLTFAVADVVRCRTEAHQVRLFVVGDGTEHCEAVATDGSEQPEEWTQVGRSVVRRALAGRTMVTEEVTGGTGDWIAVPLTTEHHVLGALAITMDRQESAARWGGDFVWTLACQVARALESAALREQVQRKNVEVEEWNRILEQRVEERTARLSATERELAMLNTDLERRVKQRTMELSEVQSRMVESGRLAAVGELAAGVAHELNNPLGGMLGYVQYDIEKLDRWRDRALEPDERKALLGHLRMVESATQRCRNIVSNLLAFAEAAGCSKEVTSINEVVRATLRMTADQLRMRGIDVRVDLDDASPDVVGSAVQLQQVFVNMVVNARNAMESGGILSIRTGVNESDERRMVFVAIEDSGHGIPSADLERVWEPFFTTREVGKGTGLGLSVSYGIVREHGGEIEVESEVGRGTTFTVLIPAAPADTRTGCTPTRMETSVDRA